MRSESDPAGFSEVLYSRLSMTPSSGKRPRVPLRIRENAVPYRSTLYLALRPAGLCPASSPPSQLPSPRAALRRRKSPRPSPRLLHHLAVHPPVGSPPRTRRPVELRPDLLAEPPHRRRDRLAQIESRLLGARPQRFDLALQRRGQLQRDRLVLLFAFENSHLASLLSPD